VILRLVDLEPGYRIGHGYGCPSRSGDVRPLRNGGTTYRYARSARFSSATPWRVSRGFGVESGAAVFQTAAGASAGYADGFGDGFHEWDNLVELPESRRPAPVAKAVEMAQAQQRRVLDPTPIGPRDNDDLEVELGDPSFRFMARVHFRDATVSITVEARSPYNSMRGRRVLARGLMPRQQR
jgi:hypothetical protein